MRRREIPYLKNKKTKKNKKETSIVIRRKGSFGVVKKT